MFTLIIILAIIWIILKVVVSVIKLPFKILKVLLSQPFSTIFWILVALYFVYNFLGH